MGTRIWIIIFLSLVVGLVYASHNFFISQILGYENYFPIDAATSSTADAVFYGPRANAVFGGQFVAGDISVFENQKSPTMLPILPPLILGFFAKVLLSLKASFIFTDFLFPALIFAALFLLAFKISGEKFYASTFFALLFVFSPKLGLWPASDALSFFTENKVLYFSRIEYPKLTFLFFVAGFLFSYLAITRFKKSDIILAGVSFGAMFYAYAYDWVYFFSGLSLMVFWFFIRKDFIRAKNLVFIILLGFAVSAFYWANLFDLKNLPQYGDLLERIGAETGRYFRFQIVWTSYLRNILLVVALVALALGRPHKRPTFVFLASFLLSYFAVVNSQVFLGFNPQPDHWHRVQFLAIALALFVFLVWIWERLDFNIPRYRFICSAAIIILFLRAVLSQYGFSVESALAFVLDRRYSESYEWLLENTPTNSVIGSISPLTNNEIILHTKNKIFLPNGANTTIESAGIMRRAEVMSKIFGLSQNDFEKFITNNSFYLFHNKYRDSFFGSYFKEGYRLTKFDDINNSVARYKRVSHISEFDEKLDYLIFGPREAELGNDSQILGKSVVYEREGVKIYAY